MRNEYPRPELVRNNFKSLCGLWDFEFDFGNTLHTGFPRFCITRIQWIFGHLCDRFTHQINVPFSPESKLSGIEYKDFINACWYRRKIDLSDRGNQRVLLHFEAVFHTSHIFINGKYVGNHFGGYTPFSFDITDYLTEGETEILLHCKGDPRNPKQPSGKQSSDYEPNGCYYDRNSGIWAPVWIEYVPKTYIKDIRYSCDIVNRRVIATVEIEGSDSGQLTVDTSFAGKDTGSVTLSFDSGGKMICPISLSELHLWEVGKGGLYDVSVRIRTRNGEDMVSSYFGMREIAWDNRGVKINGKRIFQRLVLDQGYYPDGLYTAPEEADFQKDIEMSMRLGFNGARLHQKVFDRRFLYEADKAGYICWEEYPCWGFDTSMDDALSWFLPEWMEAMERDCNHPCIVCWCPMNENNDFYGRHQNDIFVKQVYEATKKFDPTRPVIDASWNFHVKTDIYDVHDYSQGEEFVKRFAHTEDGQIFDSMRYQAQYQGQPYMISEFGGLKWPDEGTGWGYNEGNRIVSEEDFLSRLKLFCDTLYGNPRICGSCYTQLYDVQHEQNGLYYYDRSLKFSEPTLRKIAKIVSSPAEYEKLEDIQED